MKKNAIILFKAIIALALVWYLFASGRLSLAVLRSLFSLRNLPALVFSSSLFLGSQALAAFRLVLLLRTVHIGLPAGAAMNLTMIGNFFNMVLPGVVGGDVLKGYYLAKVEEEAKGRSAGIIVMDRVLGLFALSSTSAVAILYLIRTYRSAFSRYEGTLDILLAVIAASLLLFAVVLIAASVPWMRQRLKMLASSLFKEGMLYYMADGFAKLAREKRIMLAAGGLSLLIQLLGLFGLLALARALPGASPDTLVIMAVSSVIMLLGTIPLTPGNVGWVELLASLGWSAVGSSLGGQVFLSWRIVTMLCVLPWGALYLFSPGMRGIRGKAA